MAKYNAASQNKVVASIYPSTYGSHKSMLSEEHELFNEDQETSTHVVCNDERGFYLTESKNLDNGLCDRNRIDTIETRASKLYDAIQ
jgi:hypothetical protein